MNLESIYSFTPGWLVDVGLQVTVIMVVAGGVVMVWGRWMAAARRHFVMACALLMIPVVMGCSFVAPVWRVSWGEKDGVGNDGAMGPGGLMTMVNLDYSCVRPRIASTVSVATAGAAAEASPVSPLWSVLWLAGMGVGAVVLGCSALALRRLRVEARVVVDARLRRCFEEEAEGLGLRLPEGCLRMSGACAVPMTWGISQKTVLLPEAAAEWSEARLRLVLRHELAHIARGDVLITLMTTVAALLLWFHPLVWVMLRACGRAREEACDDVALERSGQSAEDFAEELLAAVAGLGGGEGASRARPWMPLALAMAMAMAVSANAKAMRLRLTNLVQAGRGRCGYSLMQKVTMVVPMLGVAFVLAGLSACRKTETTAGAAATNEVPRQILVRSRFVSIPKDSPVLAEAGLVLDEKQPPGLQSLGLLNEEQTKELLRKLSEQKGVELMSAPSVTTRSGAKATVEVAREFIYPTEFDPPKQATQKDPVIPTTPTAFEMKKVGVKMEVVPTLEEAGNLFLEVTPEATSFEGFMDYGAPITHEGKVVSENKIQQPIFYTMKTTASFVMKPGQSVVFGGLGSPDATQLTSRMPKTKDLMFFVIEADVVEAGKEVAKTNVTADVRVADAAVTVVGQVKRQGVYAFKPGMTVGDLVKEAQGLSERADATKVELRRGPKHAAQATVLDLPNGNAKVLEAGDVVTVPEK
ncbi:M56 family metallopeptidase [Prosthecobacter sp.]|uniref:M56 family metallopeptidase n=1 Tax=Prosthecobacter sp. TaxID=1965333 RepID=UPI003782F7CC